MLPQLEKALKLAIATRESGNLVKSRASFEGIITKVKKLLKKDTSIALKDFYVTLMGEFVIQYRLEAGSGYLKALGLAKDLLAYDRTNGIGNPLSFRSVSNTLMNIGDFEGAEEYLKELVDVTQNDPYKQGDAMSHLSLCLFRTGRIQEGEVLVDRAIRQILESEITDEFIEIHYTHSLMVKALILNAKGKTQEALKLAREALFISKKNKLTFRIKQATNLLDILQKRTKAL